MKTLISLSLLVFTLSCQHTETKNLSPQNIYKLAVKLEKNQDLEQALKVLQDLKQKLPAKQKISWQADLLKANILFKKGSFKEAGLLYESFFKRYPNIKRGYVLWQLILCVDLEISNYPDRDISAADKALKYIDLLAKIKSPYKKKALERKHKIQALKIKKEILQAQFFKKIDKTNLSLKRLKEVIKIYPSHPQISEALYQAYQASSNKKEKSSFKKKLLKRFPKSKEARKIKKETA